MLDVDIQRTVFVILKLVPIPDGILYVSVS